LEVRVPAEQYVWDLLLPELVGLFLEPCSEPMVGLNLRQRVATPLAMRAFRRIPAVDGLFKAGYYWESHALVRSAYEDWLEIAYLMREPHDVRCEDYEKDVHKHDARVYDAFKTLCGDTAAGRLFGNVTPEVAAFVGRPRSQTSPASFASLADDVGLRRVHDFAYTYLSGRSHPTGRIEELFDGSASIAVARIPSRDPSEETRLALWMSWFTARVAVLAARQFDINREPFCDEHLLPFAAAAGASLETCVFVREYGAS
jgi:hypothetical protein